MSTPKRKKRRTSHEKSIVEISIEKADREATLLQTTSGIYDAMRHYITVTNPIIEQALKLASAQFSLIEKMPLLSPNLTALLDAQAETIRSLSSPILDSAHFANISVGRLLSDSYSSELSKLAQGALGQSNLWISQIEAINASLKIPDSYNIALQSHLAGIAEISALSETFLSTIPFENIGNVLILDNVASIFLKDSFVDFTASYSKFFGWLSSEPPHLLSVSPALSRLPAVEFFNGVYSIDSITSNKNDFDSQLLAEKYRIEAEITAEAEDRLDTLLANVSADLLIPLRGARQSVGSDNPDRARHLSSSLRELFTQVIHRLAPDDGIRTWNHSEELYDKGKPTRRARLLYICQRVNQEPLTNFVEKDIDAALAFLDIFQRGTHEVASAYTDEQLKIMLIRMESLLRYLLEIKSI